MKRLITIALAFTVLVGLALADPYQLNQKYEFVQAERALAQSMLDLNNAFIALESTWTEMGYSVNLTQADIDSMANGNYVGLSQVALSNLISNKAGWDTYFVTGNVIDIAEAIK